MELEAKVSIKRPPDQVWAYFTNPDKWQEWWGGALTKVEPGWEEGARLVWAKGHPSTVLNMTREQEIETEGRWSNKTWSFTKETGNSTLIVFKERFTGSVSADPGTWQTDMSSRLSKFKQCVESMPSPRTQPPKKDEPSGSEPASWFRRLLGRGKRAQVAAAGDAIDRQADRWRELGFQVGGVEAAKEAARSAAAARPSEAWFDEAVDKMVSIYREHPQGFVQGSGGAPEQELRRIGEMLDQRGGMDLMRAAHAEFASRCGVLGAARNVEFVWDGIGSWMG